MPPDAGASGMAGFSHKPSHAKHLPERERGFAWVLGVRFWGLAPPADGTAGGVNHLCTGFLDVGGFVSEPPLVKSILWGKMGKEWGLRVVSPTSSDAGGVPSSAGGPIRGLSLKYLGLLEGLGGVWNLQQLGCNAPPAADVAGGAKVRELNGLPM